jgi:hypothetical protein
MATKSGLVSWEPFLPDVAANEGQDAGSENSGRLFRSKPDAVVSRLMAARSGNVIETHERKGDFKEL